MRPVMILAVLVALTLPALAQPALTPPSPAPATPAPAEEKSPSVAVALSVGVTAAGAVTLMASDNHTASMIGFGAIFLGPSTGQWYAGELGLLGIGARALGGIGMVYGLSEILQSECDAEDGVDCSGASRRGDLGAVMMIGGASLWVGSSIADVVFAKRAADRWNQRHALTLAPTAFTSGGQQVPGLVAVGRF
jgi:hypothetical protein